MARILSNSIKNIAQRANYFLRKAWKSGISKETTKKLLEEIHPKINLTKSGTVSTKQQDEKTFQEKFNGKLDELLDFGDKVSQKVSKKVDEHFEKKREKRAEKEKKALSKEDEEKIKFKAKYDKRIKALQEEGISQKEIIDYLRQVENVEISDEGHLVWQKLTPDQMKSLSQILPTRKEYRQIVHEKQIFGFAMAAKEIKTKISFEEALKEYYDVIDAIDDVIDHSTKEDLKDMMSQAGRDNKRGNYTIADGDMIKEKINEWRNRPQPEELNDVEVPFE